MSKLVIILNDSNHPVCACSECNQYIAAPSNGVEYQYCYNCGAKFNRPVTASRIKRKKLTYKITNKLVV